MLPFVTFAVAVEIAVVWSVAPCNIEKIMFLSRRKKPSVSCKEKESVLFREIVTVRKYRSCTRQAVCYKVILRRVLQASLQWRSNRYYKFWVCHCSLSCAACKAHVPYCNYLWIVELYHIFPHYLTKGKILGKKLLNVKCVLWFSARRLYKIFLI